MDRRSHFANARVAHQSATQVDNTVSVRAAKTFRCLLPVADVCRDIRSARDTQLLYGEKFEVLETVDGWAFGRSSKDGYVGYVEQHALGPSAETTHIISARSTHLYGSPDMKTKESASISIGSHLSVTGEEGAFARLDTGDFVPKQHIRPVTEVLDDPANIATSLLGVPYLWGGSSAFGIDCSGLVQLSLELCGITCPRDSDQQQALGETLRGDSGLMRGDLVFWTGHVAMMLDNERMIHANAFHMAVAIEAFEDAKRRIAKQEFGDILAIKRLGN